METLAAAEKGEYQRQQHFNQEENDKRLITMKDKVEQLLKWPEPDDQASVVSFLCFVNYLREYLPPSWVEYEKILRPFRKKDADFKKLWESDDKYRDAFLKIRGMMSSSVVVHHVDYEAAARPEISGRPYELFIDASDYGWAATLTQRPEPGRAPKVVARMPDSQLHDGFARLRLPCSHCLTTSSYMSYIF